jgi:hypothetical protein
MRPLDPSFMTSWDRFYDLLWWHPDATRTASGCHRAWSGVENLVASGCHLPWWPDLVSSRCLHQFLLLASGCHQSWFKRREPSWHAGAPLRGSRAPRRFRAKFRAYIAPDFPSLCRLGAQNLTFTCSETLVRSQN